MNAALVGYGFAGKTFHAPLIRSVSGLHLAAVVSTRAAAVSADLPAVPVLPSPADAFADPAIHLIVIATPNDSHIELARRALAAGKHVVVDKPFTITVAEAEELDFLAKRHGLLLSVFHNRRWDSDFLTLRDLISRGELGEIRHLESRFDRYRPIVRTRWREGASPGSGIWFDLGSHLVDQALQLFGRPDSISGDLAIQRDQAVAIDYFHVILRYGRWRVLLHATNLNPKTVRRFEAFGSRATYTTHGMDPQEDALRRGETPNRSGWGADSRRGTLTIWTGESPQTREIPTLPGNYPAYYEAIRDAIAKGGPNPVPPEEAIAVMRVLEQVIKSRQA